MKIHPSRSSTVKINVLKFAVALKKATLYESLVAPIYKAVGGDREEERESVGEDAKDESEPEYEKEILVHDVWSQHAHSLLLFHA